MKISWSRMTCRWATLIAQVVCAGAAASPAVAQESGAELPNYVSHAVPSPAKDSPYLLPDGSVYVLANDLVGPYFEADVYKRQ